MRINAVTRENRDEMMIRVRTAISASGAWIVDVKLFSNVSVCFSFELPSSRAGHLREALLATELHLTKESDDLLSSLPGPGFDACESQGDIAGTLQITFIHSEPDLKIDVPRIPG